MMGARQCTIRPPVDRPVRGDAAAGGVRPGPGSRAPPPGPDPPVPGGSDEQWHVRPRHRLRHPVRARRRRGRRDRRTARHPRHRVPARCHGHHSHGGRRPLAAARVRAPGPPRLRRGAAPVRPRGRRGGRRRGVRHRRDRHRRHLGDRAPHRPARHAAVREARLRERHPRLRQAVEAPRRPEPGHAAGEGRRGPPRAVARPLRRRALLRTAPAEGARGLRDGSADLRRRRRRCRPRRLAHLAPDGHAHGSRRRLRIQTDAPGRLVPLTRVPRGGPTRLRLRLRGQDGLPGHPARRAGRRSHGRVRRAHGPSRGHLRGRREHRRPRRRGRRQRRPPGSAHGDPRHLLLLRPQRPAVPRLPGRPRDRRRRRGSSPTGEPTPCGAPTWCAPAGPPSRSPCGRGCR